MTVEGKAIKEAYMREARAQWQGQPTALPVSVSISYFFGTKIKRDLDTMKKLVLDALTGIVYEDDAQVDELHLYRRYDKERPRIGTGIEAIT